MNQAKKIIALLVCIVLFVAAAFLSVFFSGTDATAESGESPIVLSEILASNRTYPAPNGQFLDFVEVQNVGDSPMDISGYMLSDNAESIGYTFPNGTILQAHSYIVCWCDKNSDSDRYAKFGISKKGEDTIYLYNAANVIVDSCPVPAANDNVPLIRLEDGSWTWTDHATPGYPNTDEGFEKWLQSWDVEDQNVVISEIVSGGSYAIVDGVGSRSDWVELYNAGSKAVTLDGAFLSNDSQDRTKWMIPTTTLEPGQRIVIRCTGSTAAEGEANFGLSRDGCDVILTGPLGNTMSMVTVPQLGKDCAWALGEDGSYAETMMCTPGYENSQAGYDAWIQELDVTAPNIRITEIMSANRSTIQNAAGELCDWVELCNTGSGNASLSGLYLSNDAADRMKWALPDVTLSAGERLVICCSGSTAADGEADFSIPRDGCSVLLSGSVGNVIDQVDVPRLNADRTWALGDDGIFTESALPSPGYANTEDGYLAFRASRKIESDLIISEVMASNNTYLRQADSECYDWVELKNVSDSPIDLSKYALSNDPGELDKYPLPAVTLEPGEMTVIICSGHPDMTTDTYPHAPFTLSAEESWVYLSLLGKTGCEDYIRVYDVPYQHSVGRTDGENGTYYFTTPTPGTANGTGVAFISDNPKVLTADGVYNDVSGVTVTLNGSGSLYYTTDGSIPTARSTPYTGPIQLTSTTVLRIINLESGKLPSDVVTASYIINENHTLPVISLAMDDDDIFGPSGIYTQYRSEREALCNVTLYEGDGGFTVDCGIEMFGHMGLTYPKKSFKITFRSAYGSKYLDYPVWGEDGPSRYKSLLIRAGQDYPKSIFRDELFTSLAAEGSENLLTQRNKFCILYINGEYFGIYCLKEAFSETYYAENKNVSVESTEVVRAPFDTGTELFDLYKFCRNNSLKNQENYDYVASKIDIDSIIDWMIFEAYCTNGDIQQNLRYFRSTETGNKWQFAYYDLDWAFYYYNGFIHTLDPNKTWQHMGFTRALAKNPDFRQQLLERCSYFYNGVLSNDHVLERIDYYHDLLEAEVPRERQRWTGSYDAWEYEVEKLRDFITDRDHWGSLISHLKRYVNLTDAEEAQYFGR